MNKKKNLIPFAVLGLSIVLASCGNEKTSSDDTSKKEPTILDKLESQVEGGNAFLYAENYLNTTFIDNDTYFSEYLGNNADYYYNSGLAFVPGVGYCSFTQLENEMGEKINDYKFSRIQLPCTQKFDYSSILYNLNLLVQYDSTKVTFNDDIATIADDDYMVNVANFIGVEPYYLEYAKNIAVKAVEDGYEFTFNFDFAQLEDYLDPIECTFQVTNFGKAKHEAFENYLKNYTPVGLTEGFGDFEDSLAEEAEPLIIDYLKNEFEWSIVSACEFTYDGLYIYDFGCGDKLEAIKTDLLNLGYEYIPEYSREGCYDFIIDTKDVTDEGEEYVSARYEVVVSYDSNEAMAEQYDYPINVFPNGAVIINFRHQNYLAPGAMEEAMKNIEYAPNKFCPTFSFEGISYKNETIDDYGRFDTDLYFTFELENEADAVTLFNRFTEAYDADDSFEKTEETSNEEGESFHIGGCYEYEVYNGEDVVDYCYVSFYLEIDEEFYSDEAVHCSYNVKYNYFTEL